MKFIILHGTKGTPEGNWFPWISSELEKLGHTVFLPQLPTPEGQTPENWIRAISETVKQSGGPDDETVFIAHSMSPLAVCLYLQAISTSVRECLFVAGFAKHLPNTPDPYPRLNDPFIDTPINWVDVRKNCKKFVCFASDDDPYVPVEIAKDFADRLAGQFILIRNAGHFGASAGYTQFAKLLEQIKQDLK